MTKVVKAALNRISDHHAALGRHLTTSIKTGTFCSYAPAERLAPVGVLRKGPKVQGHGGREAVCPRLRKVPNRAPPRVCGNTGAVGSMCNGCRRRSTSTLNQWLRLYHTPAHATACRLINPDHRIVNVWFRFSVLIR